MAKYKTKWPNPNPYKEAIKLSTIHFTIKEYQELQEERLNRVKFFQEKGIEFLANEAKDLHEWGEKVLNHLKGIYSMTN